MKQGGRTRSRPSLHAHWSPFTFWLPAASDPPDSEGSNAREGEDERKGVPPSLALAASWKQPWSLLFFCLYFFFYSPALYNFFITFQFASSVNRYRFVSVSGTASAEQPHELKLAHVCRFGVTGQIMGRTHFSSSGWWVKDGMRGRSWNFLLLPPSLCLHLLILRETENLASIATEGLRQSFLLPAHKWELTLI